MQGIHSVWNNSVSTSASQQVNRNLAANDTSGGGQASDSNSTISANDFLTLLVTEMKNQDPTANNDPNEYINQLVQVNSLEQLIDINQNLSSALGTTSTTSTSNATTRVAAAASRAGSESAQPSALSVSGVDNGQRLPVTSGNLSAPTGGRGAGRIATALSGHS